MTGDSVSFDVTVTNTGSAEGKDVVEPGSSQTLSFSMSGTLQMNDAICQLYYAKSFKARLVYKVLTRMLNKSIEKGQPDLKERGDIHGNGLQQGS